MATTGWAVIQTNYEYDDQRYNESGVLPPTKVFLRKEDAMSFVMSETFEFVRENDLDRFAYDTDDIISPEGIEFLKSLLPIIEVQRELNLDMDKYEDVCTAIKESIELISDEQREMLFGELRCKPWGMIEVSIT